MTRKYYRISAVVSCDVDEEKRDDHDLPHQPLIDNSHDSYCEELCLNEEPAPGMVFNGHILTSIVEITKEDARSAGLIVTLTKDEATATLIEAFDRITTGDLAKASVKERAAYIQKTYDSVEGNVEDDEESF